MIVHQVFAQIYEGEVKNIIVCDNYELANWLARATYGPEAFAVDCLQYPCAIGDKYHEGKFVSVDPKTGEETVILPKPTQEEQVDKLTREGNAMSEYQMDLDYRLSCQELNL